MENPEALAEYLHGSVHILRRSLEFYDRGEIVFYRVMAVELRLLLCDTTRRHDAIFDLSLVRKQYPDLALPGLNQKGVFEGLPLPLTEWLEQRVEIEPGKMISLRQIIRQVCDQYGGAHVDQRIHARLPDGMPQAEWISKIARVVVAKFAEI